MTFGLSSEAKPSDSATSGRLVAVLLAGSILSSAAHAADEVIPPKIVTLSPGGVNMSDGSFTLSDTDLSIGSLSLERFYKGGREPANGGEYPFFGRRMFHNFDIYIARRLRSIDAYSREYKPIVYMGNSASGPYKHPMNSTIVWEMSDDSSKASLDFDLTTYTYTTADGTIYTFNPGVSANGVPNSYRVSSIVYPNSRKQTFTYTSGNLLKLVLDSSGYALVFDYNSSDYVASACGFNLSQTFVSSSTTCATAQVKATYDYTSDKLTGTTNAGSEQTGYDWTGAYITCVRPAAGACAVTNTLTYWRVTSQTMADGKVWNYQPNGSSQHVTDPNYTTFEEPNGASAFTDPNGKVTSFTFVQTSPYSVTQPGNTDPVNRTTQYRFTGGRDYDSDSLDPPPPTDIHEGSTLIEATFPEGNKYLAEYAGPYSSISKQSLVAKPGSGLANRVVTSGYPPSCTGAYTRQNCAKPISIRDSNSNASGVVYQTDYKYASHGGVLYEMKPAPVAGGARPLKLTTWAPKSAYIKNSLTGPLVASTPIWMMETETQCQTVAGSNSPVCDGTAPQTVTTYQYGADETANNLLVRGIAVTTDGTTLRTCYGYDNVGNRISETKPRAGLAVCS